MTFRLRTWLSNFLNRPGKPDGQGRYVHPSVLIDGACTIGSGTSIWQLSHLFEDCSIGENCILGQNVMVGKGVRIGNGCKVQNNVSLYEGVTLEDYVFCGPSCVFTNVINPRAEIERKHEFKPTHVKRGATIGANATIVCGHEIGRYAFIGAGSVVTRNVNDFEMVVGNPAKKMGYVCKCGEKLSTPDFDETTCEACGEVLVKDSKGQITLQNNEFVDE